MKILLIALVFACLLREKVGEAAVQGEPEFVQVNIGATTLYSFRPFDEIKAAAERRWASEYQHFELGVHFYSRGEFTNAFACFSKSGKEGHPDAQYALSIMCEKGQGTEKDPYAAELWLNRAARLPSTVALTEATLAFLKKVTNSAEIAAFVGNLRIAAELGDTNATYALLARWDEFEMLNKRSTGFPDTRVASDGKVAFPTVLRGIKRVRVSTGLSPSREADEDGLSMEKIQQTAELRLRAAGIEILEDGERGFAPHLNVSIECVKSKNMPLHSVMVSVELMDTVSYRMQGLYLPIWSKRTCGLLGSGKLPTVTDWVADSVDQFANEFLKANPKR